MDLITKQNSLDEIRNLSIQKPDLVEEPQGGVGLLSLLVQAGEMLPPWWSKSRDRELRRFILKSDYLKGTIYSMIAKMTTIDFTVEARDKTITRHVEQARERTDNLVNATEFYRGWNVGFGKFLLDLYTQDNGAFFEVIGGGRPDGPIIGWPMGLAHLDSYRCQRTSNPEFPVVYEDTGGKRYKLHYTRVIEFASMPSADVDMNSVGICATSRCVDVAQSLYDIMVYESEKMGSRPPRILLAGSYISTAQINEAFRMANQTMSERGLTRFAQIVAIGRQSGEIKLEKIDLTGVPDGFDKDNSIKLGMAAIALAWGIDYREIWPATVTGATKSDATVQHEKAKGKGPGEIIQMIERLFNQKYLPPHLRMRFDFQDDASDAMQATVRKTRSDAYKQNLDAGAVTVRVVREQMLESGDITQAQFEQLELQDGRLEDGSNVLDLFLFKDDGMSELLKLPVDDPLDVKSNDAEAMVKKIDSQIEVVSAVNININRENIKRQARQAYAALTKLKELYENEIRGEIPVRQENPINGQGVSEGVNQGSGRRTQTTPEGLYRHSENVVGGPQTKV